MPIFVALLRNSNIFENIESTVFNVFVNGRITMNSLKHMDDLCIGLIDFHSKMTHQSIEHNTLENEG